MMKMNFKTLLLGALAMTGLLASCNKEKNAADGLGGEKEVSAQFVMSVATGSSPSKQTAVNVQRNNNFLGIDDARILAFNTGISDVPYVNSSTTAALKEFKLGTLYSSGQINAEENATSSSNRVLQLSIPINTDAMLFYATLINEQPGRIQGKVDAHLSNTPKDIYFDLCPRLGDNATSYAQTEALMVYVLNRVMKSEVNALAPGDSFNGYEDLPAISWQQLGIQYEINNELYGRTGTKVEQTPLEENLAKTYSMMTYIKPGEYRAGASSSVRTMITDLDKVAVATINATATNAGEANAQRLAEDIHSRIENYFTANDEYMTISTIKNRMINTYSLMTETEWNANFEYAKDLNGFPYEDFGLPMGVAQLQYNDTDYFSYKLPNEALLSPGNDFDPTHYMFPAELMYYVNSGLRVTSKDNLSISDYPDGTGPWDDDSSVGNKWTAGAWTKNGKVTSSTRGVAIRDNINYGVALLQTNVTWNGNTTLNDNRKAITNNAENDRVFSVNDAHFVLKGILIGGQNSRMGWQYLKRGASGDPALFNYVVYDDHIASSAIPTTAPNYTLLFDNYDATLPDNGQADVYVALEIQNNGDDFWGRDNMVRSGGTFYLLGQLKNSEGGTITWPTNYQVPPIYGVDGEDVPSGKTAGASKQIPRVFIQDFMTKATFRIGQMSLHNAYVTTPDLRTTQMSLGLSVDLSWETGYEFFVDL